MYGKYIAIILVTPKGVLHKEMELIKNMFWSMAAPLVAAGLLTGMVVYTVTVMRTVQMQILTGEMSPLCYEKFSN